MKVSKEYIQGYADSIIDLDESIDEELNVKANVYFNELSQCYDVTIVWSEGYDNHKQEDLTNSRDFTIENIKDFGFALLNFLDDFLSKVAYNGDYDSRFEKMQEIAERKEFEEEMKFESNRGN